MRNQFTNLLGEYVDRFLFESDIGFKWIDNSYKITALQSVFCLA